ncbi:MAG: MBL fold metallo-hydrolase [Deltaproteobacteria bacterium]|nr:MBL fold metallo-hydrolase [Deltaproteobacteria bacterium]
MSGDVPADRAAELRAHHRRMPVARHRSLALHWLAGWARPPRPAHGEPLPTIAPGQLGVTFGGHATALVRYADLDIAFDPMLGRWLGGIRRAQEPGLAPGDLDRVGLVLISHRHRDHLHLPTLALLPRSATIVVPPGGAHALSHLGFARVLELAVGGDLEFRGVQVTAAPMSHGEAAKARGLSYVVRGPGPSVYLCGDGAYFSGFASIGERFAPDVALLPIGGFAPASFRDRHMSPLDALYAFEDLRARLMVPIHHGAFALSYERLGEPARWLAQLVRERGLEAHVRILPVGGSEVLVPPRDVREPDETVAVAVAPVGPAAAPVALIEPAAPVALVDAPSASVEVAVEPTGPIAAPDAPLGALLDRLAAGIPEPSLGDAGDGVPAMFDSPDTREPTGPRDPIDALFH